jgi:hypothetical protein
MVQYNVETEKSECSLFLGGGGAESVARTHQHSVDMGVYLKNEFLCRFERGKGSQKTITGGIRKDTNKCVYLFSSILYMIIQCLEILQNMPSAQDAQFDDVYADR